MREDMADAVELVRQDQQYTSTWNGGTTTEIAIYPKNAAYSHRDFVWRISSSASNQRNQNSLHCLESGG